MLLAKNRKALFDNEILEKYTAGIILKGYEVKAIREHNVNFEGSFISLDNRALYLKNLSIGKYSKQSQEFDTNASKTPKKLLLNKTEINKVIQQISEKGKTAIPLAFVLLHNIIKLEFAVVRGRKKFEKKEVLKIRQIDIDLRRENKEARYF